MSALQIIAIVICLATTVVAVALLTRTVNHYLATFRLGQPEYRGDNKGERTGRCCASSSTHSDGAPGRRDRALGDDGRLRLPVPHPGHGVRPALRALVRAALIGHFPPFEWITEALAWTGLVDPRCRRDPSAEPPAFAPGDGGRRSRFFGSTWWQAYYVELTILGVMFASCCSGRSSTPWSR